MHVSTVALFEKFRSEQRTTNNEQLIEDHRTVQKIKTAHINTDKVDVSTVSEELKYDVRPSTEPLTMALEIVFEKSCGSEVEQPGTMDCIDICFKDSGHNRIF